MKTLRYIFASLVFLATPAFAMKSEIQAVNRDYGQSQGYPILTLDKEDVKLFLKSHNLNSDSSARDLVGALMVYFKERFKKQLPPADVFELLPYLTGVNRGASAMPFFLDRVHFKPKYCVVLPGEPEANHLAEVKRILGADKREDLIKGLDINKVASFMTTEEIQLFSLYHELAHCLDQKFLPSMYEADTDPHKVHLAEAFAETTALFLMSQRKGLQHLGYPRSLIRTAYSKYYGAPLAQSGPAMFSKLVVNSGGSTYFLAPVSMKAQEMLDTNSQLINSMPLPQTLELSQKIVEQFAFSKDGFNALRLSFSDGREFALAHHRKMATKAPRIFAGPYQELIDALSMMDSLDEKISKYPERK